MPDLYDDLVGFRPTAAGDLLPDSLETHVINAVHTSRRRRIIALAAVGTAAAVIAGVALWQGVPRATAPLVPATGTAQPTASSLGPTPSTTASPGASVSAEASRATQPETPTTPAGGAVTSGPPPVTARDVRTVVQGNFITPSGRIACVMSSNVAFCEYLATDLVWRDQFCRISDWGVRMGVEDVVTSGCHSDSNGEQMTLSKDDAWYAPEVVSWWRTGDPTVSYPRQPGQSDRVLAALPYGSALRNSRFLCESATTGVTCRNTVTGHGFTMSREAYSIF